MARLAAVEASIRGAETCLRGGHRTVAIGMGAQILTVADIRRMRANVNFMYFMVTISLRLYIDIILGHCMSPIVSLLGEYLYTILRLFAIYRPRSVDVRIWIGWGAIALGALHFLPLPLPQLPPGLSIYQLLIVPLIGGILVFLLPMLLFAAGIGLVKGWMAVARYSRSGPAWRRWG